MTDYSVVEIFPQSSSGHSCGYCNSPYGSRSYGMWAHRMTVQDYQDLIDRGWRRSGKYCYKPSMRLTCCPQYTIKCSVQDFQLTKSQKKVLKRMQRFLSTGQVQLEKEKNKHDHNDDKSATDEFGIEDMINVPSFQLKGQNVINENICLDSKLEISDYKAADVQNSEAEKSLADTIVHSPKPAKICKKAKVLRQERRLQKLAAQGKPLEIKQKTKPQSKLIEDFLLDPSLAQGAHKLEVRIVQSQPRSREFEQTFAASFQVYKKYQMTVHNDPESKCTSSQFSRFLVDSPLLPKHFPSSSSSTYNKYGSFHQQYWLDGNIIAVGVIDILPKCVSSVYFYYDPKYSFLSLGTYAALREIAFTREIMKFNPDLRYYYMGFYIHSCPKMRYKSQYRPSFILCPETYRWYPYLEAKLELDSKKYSRLEKRSDIVDENENVPLPDIMVLHDQTRMKYRSYSVSKQNNGMYIDDSNEVMQYAKFVGKICAQRMLLYRE